MKRFYDMSHNIEYCKNCPHYKSNPLSYYDCCTKDPTSTDNGWGFCKQRVLTFECHKFMDELNDNEDLDEQSSNYIMPFGKYKGKKLKDIPYNYIDWLNRQGWLKLPLVKYIRAYDIYEYRRRNQYCGDIFDSCDPYDVCPFSMYNEVGYGELC